MGLVIKTLRDAGPYPRPTVLILSCDGDPSDHGLFGDTATFVDPDGFIAHHQMAMRAGWMERQDSRGRLWLGPCCSGKGGMR